MTNLHSWFFAFWLILYLSICRCDVLVQYYEGESATLPCRYDSRYHGKCHICWMKGEIPNMGCGDELIGSDGDKVVRRKSDRYQLAGDIQHGDVSMTISNIQKSDSGKYGCRIHVPGLFNDEMYYVNLIVKTAPIPTTQETASMTISTSKRETTVFTSAVTEAPVPTTPEPVAVTIIPGHITTETQSTHTTRETDTTQASSSNLSTSGALESTTIGLWPLNTTHVDNFFDYHESSSVESREKVNTSAIIVPVLLLLLAVIVIAVILIWKQKRKRRVVAEIAQDSDNSVIYNNSGSSVGLYNREMAMDNIYQIEPETEYEQWH